ncbi:tetratricopeptide repeat protein [Marinobacter sp. CA1]|uniref:tetratricopeptide repeat protein n=1 Tax=Marinobacter sp. CA1 TaxID=2817656 RepID=UPI001D088526|nr:tetratricopeptide repeat protein [Marinobacter sp. CA1]UDL04059.1 tetratricopeptide repeat protein [Marinobacter sp. CA1]
MIRQSAFTPRRSWLVLAMAASLGGCQSLSPDDWFGDDEPQVQPHTLATLQPADLSNLSAVGSTNETSGNGAPGTGNSDPGRTTESLALADVIASYEALLPLLQASRQPEDQERLVQVRHRLADLRFQQAEERLADQAVDDLAPAIAAYQRLLRQYPDRASNDQVLYQLAKAYDLKGEREAHLQTLERLIRDYPASALVTEAQFRRGEQLFTEGRYRASAEAYGAVIAGADGEDQRFLADAHFMIGWCAFKLAQYQDSLMSFTRVLDRVLPADTRIAGVDQRHRTMVEDLFRVMGLAFTHLGGADSVERLFRDIGSKPYETLVYDRYSEQLLANERYSDAIEVFQRYIANHPDSRWSPRYHLAIIDTLQRAGFSSDIGRWKADFILNYGITSGYWQQASAPQRDELRTQLEPLLTELANRHYALAQRAEGSGKRQQARAQYQSAAFYYGEFVATFPDHARTPEILFLLAETHLALAQWPEAIAAFEQVAYGFDAHPRAAEAGYAIILGYRDYVAALAATAEPAAEQRRALVQRQQRNRLRFVTRFASDPRALDVLYVATRHEFEHQRYQQTLRHAQRLIDWQPLQQPELMAEAQLLKAHSLYQLRSYAAAEQAYQEALLVMAPQDRRRADITENLAASVYRQADDLLAAGDTVAAVEQLLRVGQVAPGAALRANAQYDAASYLIELADWDRAIAVLDGFRRDYPDHELNDELPAKLALAYRETGQWQQAADETRRLLALADSEDERRQTLILVAELYDRAGNTGEAIVTWRRYANRYPQPLAAYMTAADRLAELYAERDDVDKRRYWLQRQVAAVDAREARNGSVDDYLRYQAAGASAALAEEAYQAFLAIELTLPLQQTLPAKIRTLETAVAAYRKTSGYGVADFATEAGYRIADLYAQLGAALMDSERPQGLSELELMQYELLLEEQAYPFEDNAIDIHEQNARRSWNGLYDDWVRQSFEALAQLLPARYNKAEQTAEVINELR